MKIHRVAVVGSGFMAQRRIQALLSTGRVALCAIASHRGETARALAQRVGCPESFSNYREISRTAPDALLVEVPHAVQDDVVLWALEHDLHVLVGGPLASSVAAGRSILEAARRESRVVEAGYEARYKPVWETAKDLVEARAIGRPVAVRSVALWAADPSSWYYRQDASGGMPLTHMTYAFINPLRWLFGDPVRVSAFANRIRHAEADKVREETCVANLLFPGEVLASMLAGYVEPSGDDSWKVSIVGTRGALEILPTELESGSLRLYRGSEMESRDFSEADDGFVAQAEAFCDALEGRNRCRNPPASTLGDLEVAEAIALSARGRQVVAP